MLGEQRGARPAALLGPGFLALLASELAYFIAYGLMIPAIPLFAIGRLGAGPAAAGLAYGAFSLAALLIRPLAGWGADRFGRLPVLRSGSMLFVAGSLALLVVPNLASLVGARLVLGTAQALYFVAVSAMVADLAPPGRLGEAISYNSLALYVGIAVGPALGEWLIGQGGFTLTWLAAAALAGLATLLALRIPETGARAVGGRPGILLNRQVLFPGIAFVSGMAALGGFLAFAALYARGVGFQGAHWVLGVFGVLVIVSRLALARLSDRGRPLRTGAVALLLCAVGLGAMALWAVPAGLLVGAALLAGGVALVTPAFGRAIMAGVAPDQRGRAAAAFSVFIDLGLGGGPILVGLVVGAAGLPSGLAVAAAAATLGAVICLVRPGPQTRPGTVVAGGEA